MSILSGYKKVKNYIETGSGKKLLSRWTSSNTVEFNDGKTAQTKVGAIKGITTSTSATETGYAADATTVAALNQSLDNINDKNTFQYLVSTSPFPIVKSTPTNISLANNRKISSYRLLIFFIFTNKNTIRNSIIIPAPVFQSIKTVNINYMGSDSVNRIVTFKYIDDTNISLVAEKLLNDTYAGIVGYSLI